jgi:hypothetical protein
MDVAVADDGDVAAVRPDVRRAATRRELGGSGPRPRSPDRREQQRKGRRSVEEEEEDAAEWAFPLRYVPEPADVEQIISDLNQRFSVSKLLRVIKEAARTATRCRATTSKFWSGCRLPVSGGTSLRRRHRARIVQWLLFHSARV